MPPQLLVIELAPDYIVNSNCFFNRLNHFIKSACNFLEMFIWKLLHDKVYHQHASHINMHVPKDQALPQQWGSVILYHLFFDFEVAHLKKPQFASGLDEGP